MPRGRSRQTSAAPSMLLLLTRPPLPDARPWPGRRWFALVDALAWPMVWLAFAVKAMPDGLAAWAVAAALTGCTAVRCWRALWLNHRYRFTTWRWGRAIVALLALGALLKLAQPF